MIHLSSSILRVRSGSICLQRIGRRGKIWSCDRCFIIIHRSCMQNWASTNLGNDQKRDQLVEMLCYSYDLLFTFVLLCWAMGFNREEGLLLCCCF